MDFCSVQRPFFFFAALLLLLCSPNLKSSASASFVGLDANNNILLSASAGKNVSVVGESVLLNGVALHEQLALFNASLAAMQALISSLNASNADLLAQVSSHNKSIARLEDLLSSENRTIVGMEQSDMTQNSSIALLEAELSALTLLY